MKKGGGMRELRESSDCSAMGTDYREAVLSGAVAVLSEEYEKVTRSCFESVCSVLPTV